MSLRSLRDSVGRASLVDNFIGESFEKGCISLLTRAYNRFTSSHNYQRTWHENMFTAHLVIHMEQICEEEDVNLLIDPECYQYFQEVLNGTTNPDQASRIDVRLKGGWRQRDIYYGIEAKILVENNWETRRASPLRTRYIKTGINNFIDGNYSPVVPKGCLVGYVVEGNPSNIQQAINQWLFQSHRSNEVLKHQHEVEGCQHCFLSKHIRVTDQKSIRLYHVLLPFT